MKKQMTEEEHQKKKMEDEAYKAEEQRLIAHMKPSPPEKTLLNLTSIHDLLNALDRMSVYDRLMSELKLTNFENYEEENRALASIGQPYTETQQLLPDIDEHR